MELISHNLECVRGGRCVFQGLSFRAAAGKGLLLTGPNGSGKSSLLRVIAGFIPAAAGKLELRGGDEDAPLGEQCHYVGHLNGVKRTLTVSENLAFWVEYLGGGNAISGEVERALAAFDLESLAGIPARLLSAGQARRLGLARIALVDRPLWLLDEPTVSLDSGSQKLLARVIKDHLKGGGIVIAATHAPLGVKFSQTLKLGSRSAGRGSAGS
ncbi:MAG: heme ABC exporter ATP-binding protein CcmA [Alphaproteobacteria bacterium]